MSNSTPISKCYVLLCYLLSPVGLNFCRELDVHGNLTVLRKSLVYRSNFKSDVKLSKTLQDLFQLQVLHWFRIWKFHSPITKVITIYQDNLWPLVVDFQDNVYKHRPETVFLNFEMYAFKSEPSDWIGLFHEHFHSIQILALFLDDNVYLKRFMDTVCLTDTFKWTYLRDLTEWVVISKNPRLWTFLQELDPCIDFLTMIIALEDTGNIILARKSRGTHNSSLAKIFRLTGKPSLCVLQTFFPDLRRPKMSSMEGMHLPIVVLDYDKQYSSIRRHGNETVYEGYAIAIAKVLESYLHFTSDFILPPDGENYGYVRYNGTPVGITGVLARREAALTTMDMAVTANRQPLVDYSICPLSQTRVHTVYKLPSSDDKLDTTLLGIVHAEFLLAMLGPTVLILISGALTHILTKSCTEASPRFSWGNLRRLSSFPDHIFFQRERIYASQTGRVLKATWGLFWIIFGAAYSAHLVTTFTVKPTELKIDSIEKLYDALTSNFRVGLSPTSNAMITLLETSNDTTLRALWKRVVELNESYPDTFSSNKTEHIIKMTSSNLIMFGQTTLADFPYYSDVDTSQVRQYEMGFFDSIAYGFVTFPKNTFYREEVDIALFRLEAAGVLSYFKKKYDVDAAESTSGSAIWSTPTVKERRPVSIKRFLLLIYVTTGGILLAVVALLVEIFLSYCSRRI